MQNIIKLVYEKNKVEISCIIMIVVIFKITMIITYGNDGSK